MVVCRWCADKNMKGARKRVQQDLLFEMPPGYTVGTSRLLQLLLLPLVLRLFSR